jgi:hypothetical protein
MPRKAFAVALASPRLKQRIKHHGLVRPVKGNQPEMDHTGDQAGTCAAGTTQGFRSGVTQRLQSFVVQKFAHFFT